jgi:hypothetical protein
MPAVGVCVQRELPVAVQGQARRRRLQCQPQRHTAERGAPSISSLPVPTGTPNGVRPSILRPVPAGIESAANSPQYFPAATCIVANVGAWEPGKKLGHRDGILRSGKDAKVTERISVEVRVDAFNLISPTLGDPTGS